MSSIKRVFLTFFACLILLFSFVFPAFAVDYTFSVNIPNPVEIGYSGYFTIPYTNGTNTYLEVVFWRALRTNTSYADDIVAEDLLVTINFTSKSSYEVKLEHVGGDVIFGVIGTTNTQYNYNVPPDTYLMTDSIPYSRSFGCPSGYTYLYPQQSSGIYRIDSNSLNGRPIVSQLPIKSYSVAWGYDDSYNQLNEIITHFGSMLQKQDYTNEQLETLLEQFQLLLDSVYNMEYSLDTFVFYYWEQFQNNDFPNSIYAITSRLDKIYNLLNKKGEVEQTTVDSSKVDQYADIEQSLVHNDEANSAIGDMDVSIDGQSYSVIWDIITNILNSHPEVFGLVITILTLGFLALILNR